MLTIHQEYKFFVNFITSLVAILTLNFLLICPLQAIQANDDFVMLIIDNSGSMAEVHNGEIKLETAKEAIYKIINDESFDKVKMGLIELGGKCEVKELVKPDIYNRIDLENAIEQVKSRRYRDASTPIAEAINKAARIIEKNKKSLSQTARIVLVSDGEANCLKEDEYPLTPCEIVGSLNQRNIKLDLTVIGYGVSQKKDKEFNCIASLSENYQYYSVNNPQEFTQILTEEINPSNSEPKSFLQLINEVLENLTVTINTLEGMLVAILALVGTILALRRSTSNRNNPPNFPENDNDSNEYRDDQDEYYR